MHDVAPEYSALTRWHSQLSITQFPEYPLQLTRDIASAIRKKPFWHTHMVLHGLMPMI
jgi:hypothetical protein